MSNSESDSEAQKSDLLALEGTSENRRRGCVGEWPRSWKIYYEGVASRRGDETCLEKMNST
ncbi:hypothetical protein H5410_036988 [Solanum commersonii]|uniref:Uncharacterized protein n=1 Tax=Solanum commersonii TaxID=4109 RepID=A0A9J5Y8Z9_SOLCO|nr:hypothetical protein H5410_036988 [Solanum commersonii]